MKRKLNQPVSAIGISSRSGLSVVEVVVVLLILGILAGVSIPLIQQGRERSRKAVCGDHLRQLGLALNSYHDAHRSFPAAAVWSTTATRSLALHMNPRVDLYTQSNWALALLPFTSESRDAATIHTNLPIASIENQSIRTRSNALMNCPADAYNRSDNPHRFEPVSGRVIEFARGNYAINGGTQNHQWGVGSTASPTGDSSHLVIDEASREFRFWGNGIAGFNQSFSRDDFVNGASTLVALEEIRAGIHPLDPRGSWALGQIAASITWAHGVNGDDYGPNNQWARSDDILGCGKLHDVVGTDVLMREGMPCVSYLDQNQNATARSQHPGGVNVLMLDGSLRFVADQIDPGVWHVMHSRETPAELLADDFDELLATVDFPDHSKPPISQASDVVGEASMEPFTNSIGMAFVPIPAGEFTMGIPDLGNNHDPPPECPAHRVRITRPFLLAAYEVTNSQYRRVMQQGLGSEPPRDGADDGKSQTPLSASVASTDDRLPATNMSWNDAVLFCERLSELPEEQAADRKYRLPTEAEWEYACRAGTSEPYPWRDRANGLTQHGESAGHPPGLPLTDVGSYPPNPFGLYDMRGNAWEWTADWFDRDYYLRSPTADPRGPEQGHLKVVRGGDWRFVGETCRIDYATAISSQSNPQVGFRTICDTFTVKKTAIHH